MTNNFPGKGSIAPQCVKLLELWLKWANSVNYKAGKTLLKEDRSGSAYLNCVWSPDQNQDNPYQRSFMRDKTKVSFSDGSWNFVQYIHANRKGLLAFESVNGETLSVDTISGEILTKWSTIYLPDNIPLIDFIVEVSKRKSEPIPDSVVEKEKAKKERKKREGEIKFAASRIAERELKFNSADDIKRFFLNSRSMFGASKAWPGFAEKIALHFSDEDIQGVYNLYLITRINKQ